MDGTTVVRLEEAALLRILKALAQKIPASWLHTGQNAIRLSGILGENNHTSPPTALFLDAYGTVMEGTAPLVGLWLRAQRKPAGQQRKIARCYSPASTDLAFQEAIILVVRIIHGFWFSPSSNLVGRAFVRPGSYVWPCAWM